MTAAAYSTHNNPAVSAFIPSLPPSFSLLFAKWGFPDAHQYLAFIVSHPLLNYLEATFIAFLTS